MSFVVCLTVRPNQIARAHSRYAGQLDGLGSHNVVVAVASALPAAVAQFHRSRDGRSLDLSNSIV
jgi:hypothetical protein